MPYSRPTFKAPLPAQQFAKDVLLGLSSRPKTLPSKYIYDDAGSELFERIMDLDEYYPTRAEAEIMRLHAGRFADLAGNQPFNLVELGAGNGEKTQSLLRHFKEAGLQFRYVPIDISEGALQSLEEHLTEAGLQDVKHEGIVADYFEGLNWLQQHSRRRNVILFMGGNIGNLAPDERRAFLRSLWIASKHDDLLCIGMDLKKTAPRLNAAYNDGQGVTAQFNLNLLKRINAELGGDFNLTDFEFYATFNPFSGAVESFLLATNAVEVHVAKLGRTFSFEAWEPIHTEYSFKFTEEEAGQLAHETGFALECNLHDTERLFMDTMWRVVKEESQDH